MSDIRQNGKTMKQKLNMSQFCRTFARNLRKYVF